MLYSGKVTLRNGTPLENVPVTDGRNVCRTDKEGRFVLDGWERARFIHVDILTTWHDDWYLPIDGHKGDFDFRVSPAAVSNREFCFLHTSDTEIESRDFCDAVTFMRQKVVENSPAFFMHTGDLCRDGGVQRHYLAMNRETMGCPVRYAIGNHDRIGFAYGEEIYEKYYGPTWYSFDCGEIHFVVLEFEKGDKPSAYAPEDQYIWLKNDLKLCAEGKRVIVLTHSHCREDEFGYKINKNGVETDFRKEGLLAWVFGHSHMNPCVKIDGVYNINTARPDTGGVDSTPSGVRKISIKGEELSTELLYTHTERTADACLWHTKLPSRVAFCDPICYDGDIFTATFDDGYPRRCGVYRIDGESGAIKWEYLTECGIKNELAVDGDRVYAQDSFGVTHCISAESGKRIWTGAYEVKDDRSMQYVTGGCLVIGDMLVTGDSHHVYARNKNDGTVIWDTVIILPCNSPAMPVYDEKRDRILISGHWLGLFSLDRATGKIIWENRNVPLWFRTATPRIEDGIIYTAGNRDICAVSAENGEILYQHHFPFRVDVKGAPAIDGDILYYPNAERGVVAVSKADMTPLRFFATEPSELATTPYVRTGLQSVESAPRILGDKLIFAANDGNIYFYNKNTACLDKKIRVGSPILTTPTIADGKIFVADFDGNIRKFKI